MSHGRVINENEVFLNDRFYRIDGGVKRDLISHQPPKISIGPFTKDDNPVVSTITWTNFPGGIGTEVIRSPEDYQKAYWANIPVVQEPLGFMPGWSSQVATGVNSGTAVWYAPGTSSCFYVVTTNSSPAAFIERSTGAGGITLSTRTLAASPTDSTWGLLSTSATAASPLKQFLIVAQGASGIDFGHDLPYANFSSNSTGVTYITIYKDRLWGVNSSNELMFTPTPATTWTIEAQVPVSTNDVTGLLVAPSEDAPEALYAVTKDGLYLYDEANQRFSHIRIAQTADRNAGKAFISHQGAIYYSAGQSVYRYTPSAGAVESVGLARSDRSLYQFAYGRIQSFTAAGPYLFAQLTNDGQTTSLEAIYRFSNNVWEAVVDSTATSSSRVIFNTHIQAIRDVPNNRVAVFYDRGNNDGTFYSFEVPTDENWENRLTSTGKSGGLAGTGTNPPRQVITPWIKRDTDQSWLALSLEVDIQIPTTSMAFEPYYALNYSTAFTSFGRSTVGGAVTYNMTTAASTADTQGIVFDAIRFRFSALSCHTSLDGSVIMRRATFSFKKSFKPIYSFTFIVDATEDYKGYTPMQIREGLEAVSTTPTLVEFTFKDELSATNVSEQHWVALQEMQSAEQTGKDNSKFIVTLSEAL